MFRWGGGANSLKDFYRNKVLNGTFDVTVTATVYDERVQINEGGFKVDTTNQQVYYYFDFTALKNLSSPTGYNSVIEFSSNFANYLPRYTTSSRNNMTMATTDLSSDQNLAFFLGYASSSYPRRLAVAYGQTLNIGSRCIVYGSWNY